jgi:hypothetical protein
MQHPYYPPSAYPVAPKSYFPANNPARVDPYAEILNVRGPENEYMSPAEAEKALRDLIGGGINVKKDTEIDMSQAIVPGFRDNIRLLPHQVLGRIWMKDREDVKEKRNGGILADDMG